MIRKSIVFLLAGLSSFIISGCSRQPERADNSKEKQKPHIALVMKSLANEFFKTMEEGAKAYQSDHREEFDLLVNGIKNEEDVAGQVNLVEQMLARGVDALVIAPADSKALISSLERAMKNGVIVVNIDNKLDTKILSERKLSIPFVGPDNRKGARLAGEYLAKHLHKGDPVAVINGIPSAFNAIQRRLGFEDAMKSAGLPIVASQNGNWEMAKANQVASGIINEHPEIKAILCANDSMALGAVSALESAGRTDVLVVGYDNISAAQDLIRQGKMLCTVDQHADKLAVYGIQYALQILKEHTTPSDQETPVELISAETLKKKTNAQ